MPHLKWSSQPSRCWSWSPKLCNPPQRRRALMVTTPAELLRHALDSCVMSRTRQATVRRAPSSDGIGFKRPRNHLLPEGNQFDIARFPAARGAKLQRA